tara:strand:+ start:1132 stop:2235 length:1104 start_codon:yes stop_codon:yes gene_type:complete
MAEADYRQESIQRRPEYIELREKALLDAIFGKYDPGSNAFSDGLIQDPNLFQIAPYEIAGQYGRDETGAITGLGPETFATQAMMVDRDEDGIPDFLGRYQPYFDTAGALTTGAGESLSRGLGALGEAKQFFVPATEYVSGGRGMYDPSTYVEKFMSPYTENVIKELDDQAQVARNRLKSQAVGSGAFGGSREGVQNVAIEEAILDAKAKVLDDNYKQALAASMGAYEKGATRELEAGRLMGGLGQTVGQLGSQFGSLGGQYGSLAGTTADIGRVASALTPADLSFMSGIGQQERMFRQQMIDAQRAEAQRPTEQALLPYNYAYGALSGTPSANLYSTTQQSVSPAANPFVSGLGAYTALQGINQQSS